MVHKDTVDALLHHVEVSYVLAHDVDHNIGVPTLFILVIPRRHSHDLVPALGKLDRKALQDIPQATSFTVGSYLGSYENQ